MIKVLVANGVRIVVGTDAGATPDYPPGYPTHREMELATHIGMTPEQIITAATKDAMRAARFELVQYLVQESGVVVWHIGPDSITVRNVSGKPQTVG